MIVRMIRKFSAISSGMLLLIAAALLSTAAVAQKRVFTHLTNHAPVEIMGVRDEVRRPLIPGGFI